MLLIFLLLFIFFFFFFNDTATTEIYTLSLHDALPIFRHAHRECVTVSVDKVDFREPIHVRDLVTAMARVNFAGHRRHQVDRKSTRLNSSHLVISYAVFCLKKKKKRRNFYASDPLIQGCLTSYVC